MRPVRSSLGVSGLLAKGAFASKAAPLRFVSSPAAVFGARREGGAPQAATDNAALSGVVARWLLFFWRSSAWHMMTQRGCARETGGADCYGRAFALPR